MTERATLTTSDPIARAWRVGRQFPGPVDPGGDPGRPLGGIGGQRRWNGNVVHADKRRGIAAPQAGDRLQLDTAAAEPGAQLVTQATVQLGRAGQVARHVTADRDLDGGRRARPEVGVEAGQALQAVEGNLGTLREGAEVGLAQVAMLLLESVQVANQPHPSLLA